MRIPRGNKATWTLLCLTLVAMVAQVIPFLLFPASGARQCAGVTLPSNYPMGYAPTDYAKAHTLNSALFWGGLMRTVTNVLALLTLLFSGLTERIGAVSTSTRSGGWQRNGGKGIGSESSGLGFRVRPSVFLRISALGFRIWFWLCHLRISFLAGVFLGLQLIGLPFRYCGFQHLKAFGLSVLDVSGWERVVLAGLALPLVFFVFRNVFVTCTLPVCKRFWWIVSAVSLFLIGHITPEIISRTYPVDPVENLQPLKDGPHYEAMKGLLRKAGLDLAMMVVDESHRSKTADISLTGRAGREYVLVTDTFLQDYSPEEVTVALAHELGHLQHRTRTLLIDKFSAFLVLLLTFGLVFLLSGRRALPVSSAPRVVVLLMLSSMLVSFASAPISLALSRSEERFADRHALEMTGNAEAFAHLLLKVAQHEFEPLDLPRWKYYLGASHPTFLERIAAASSDTSSKMADFD